MGLINIASNITILTNGEKAPEFRADNVTIDTKKIEEIHGNQKVEEIEFSDHSKLKVDGIFVAQGVAGSTEFAKKLGAMTKQDKMKIWKQTYLVYMLVETAQEDCYKLVKPFMKAPQQECKQFNIFVYKIKKSKNTNEIY